MLTLHDVVTVSDETEANSQSDNSNLPGSDIGLGGSGLASRPGTVHTSPDANSVANIVGTVSERGSAGSDDLDEGVEMLDLVGVLLGVAVHALHAATLGRSGNADLGSVDVVVGTIESGDDNHGGNALEEGNQVVSLVDGAGAHGVLVEEAHGPAEKTLLLAQLGVVTLLGLLDELLVLDLGGGRRETLFVVRGRVDGLDAVLEAGGLAIDADGLFLGGGGIVVRVLLHNGVVGNVGLLGVGGSLALEQKRAADDHPPLDGVVLLDDLGVDVGDEEDGGQGKETEADAEGHGNDVPGGLVGETESGGALVHDGESADGAGNQEEEGRRPHSPGNRVLAHVHNDLDQHEDDGTEASSNSRGHGKTSKDGTESRAAIPAPLNTANTSRGNTNTGNGRDERVCRGNVGRVARAPHDPDGGAGRGAGKGEQLHAGVALEGLHGDDAVLDGGGGSRADGEGAEEFEDQAEDHGHAVRDGPRGHAGCPGVGNIVWSELVS